MVGVLVVGNGGTIDGLGVGVFVGLYVGGGENELTTGPSSAPSPLSPLVSIIIFTSASTSLSVQQFMLAYPAAPTAKQDSAQKR